MNGLGWLSEYSEPAVRSALRVAGGGLDRLPIELTGTNDLSRPTWASGSATVDGRFLCKFAFSEPTAVRVWHEARVLKLLANLPAFDVPEVVAASPDPACLATRIVEGGVPLCYDLVRTSLPARADALGAGLARFLANLHAPQILALARERLDDPLRTPEPGLQATTDELRLRFTPIIEGSPSRACAPMVQLGRRAAGSSRRAGVRSWRLPPLQPALGPARAPPAPRRRLRNERCRRARIRLSGHSQLRAWRRSADLNRRPLHVAHGPRTQPRTYHGPARLHVCTSARLHVCTSARLHVCTSARLHVCTALGDALWRTEAGLPLLLPRPGGGTPDDYVDELAARRALLGIRT